MDLKQRKLNRSEWDSIEVPVSQPEMDVLNLIVQGSHNVNLKLNHHNSIFTFLKIEYSTKMEDYLFTKYFKVAVDKIETMLIKNTDTYKCIKVDANIQIKSADKIRLERNDDATLKKQDIYENVLIGHIEKLCQYNKTNPRLAAFHYYTLYKLSKNSVSCINRHISVLTQKVLDLFADEIDMSVIIENAVEFIERNPSLL